MFDIFVHYKPFFLVVCSLICLLDIYWDFWKKSHSFFFPKILFLRTVDDAVDNDEYGEASAKEWGLETTQSCWGISLYPCIVVYVNLYLLIFYYCWMTIFIYLFYLWGVVDLWVDKFCGTVLLNWPINYNIRCKYLYTIACCIHFHYRVDIWPGWSTS